MEQLNLFSQKKNGELQITNKQALEDWVKNLPEDEWIAIRFTLQKNFRSYRQIRLLYKLFREISKKTGQEVEDVKLLMKVKAGLCVSHKIEEEDITVCKSISDFSKKELSEFIEFVDSFAVQTLGLIILNQDDKSFLHG